MAVLISASFCCTAGFCAFTGKAERNSTAAAVAIEPRVNWFFIDLLFLKTVATGSWLNNRPTGIGVEFGNCGCRLCSGLPQVLLDQHAVLAHHECHHPGIAIFSGIGDEGEPAHHLAVDDIVPGPAGCVTALLSQHTEVVTMEWLMRGGLCAIPFGGCKRQQRSQWALGLTLRRLPI